MKKSIAILLALCALSFNSFAAEPIKKCELGDWCIVTNQAEIDANINLSPITIVAIDSNSCIYCDLMAPVIEKLAIEYSGRVQFLKLDMYDNDKLAKPLPNRGTPNYFIFRNGELTEMKIMGAPTGNGMKELRKLETPFATMEESLNFVRPYAKKEMKKILEALLEN